MERRVEAVTGHTLGALLAVFFSIIVNKSVVWALFHYLCSWFYVVWAIVVHTEKIQGFLEKL